MSKTENFLKWLLIIIAMSIIWNFIIPGLVAYSDNVFSLEGIKERLNNMENKFPEYSKKSLEKLHSYEEKRKDYEQIISDIDNKVSFALKKNEGFSDVEILTRTKAIYEKELAELKKPVKIVSFYESQTQYYFSAITIFLSLCVFLIKPTILKKINWKKLIVLAITIYLCLQSTNWIRSFSVFDEFRPVFSYAHYDISPKSFFLQEIRAVTICFLISLLWQQWVIFQDETVQKVEKQYEKSFSIIGFNDYTNFVIEIFSLWQINLLVVVLAFFPWTFFYWNNFISLGDNRFIIPALFIHIIWVISWGLISAPLVYIFYKWTLFKAKSLALLSSESNKIKETEKKIDFVKELNPLSNFQLIGAGVASVISFLLPLVNLLFK